jgi:hypothetical protein
MRMNAKGLRFGVLALIVGGALTGGLLLGGSLVSAQTPDNTPPAGSTQTTPDVTPPSTDQAPSNNNQTPDAGTDHTGHDCPKDKMGDGTSSSSGGTSFRGRGGGFVQ